MCCCCFLFPAFPTTYAFPPFFSRSTLATSPPWTTSWREGEWAWEWGGKEGHSMSAEAPYPWTAPRPRPPSAHPWPCRQQEEEGRHQAWEGLLLRNEIVIYTHPGWIFLTFRIFMCLFPEQLIYLRELLHFSRIKRTVPKIFYQKDKYITHAQVLKELGVHFKCRFEPISFFFLSEKRQLVLPFGSQRNLSCCTLCLKRVREKEGAACPPSPQIHQKPFLSFPLSAEPVLVPCCRVDVELCVHSSESSLLAPLPSIPPT